MEGPAKGKGTNDGPASPEERIGHRADEVVPDSGRDFDVAENFGQGLVFGGGAE